MNGESVVVTQNVDEILYHHLEFEDFEFTLANGLAVESYRDVDNRCEFDNYLEWLCAAPHSYREPVDLGIPLVAS